MAVQTLNEVQRAFISETVRPFLEDMVRITSRMDTFMLDYDNQQNAIATTETDLGDGVDGTAPRTDAPVMTGTQLGTLRTIVTTMRAGITAGQYNALISLLVRDLNTVIRS